jgi:NtrC-family two-component system response regulator AlgB
MPNRSSHLRAEVRRLAVLVVDDERNIRQTLRVCLELMGADVSEASSAKAALEISAHRVFDVVFLDLRLGATNGLDLIPPFLAENPDVAIIVITAYATIETAVKAIKTGAWDYLQKPFTPAEIRTLLERVVDQFPEREEPSLRLQRVHGPRGKR